MFVAAYEFEGKSYVGMVSRPNATVTAFDLDPAESARGALPIIERAAAGKSYPPLTRDAHLLASIALKAPIPVPRRNLFCVGRNYREHARELSNSVFKTSSDPASAWPIVFTKVPECVVGTEVVVRLVPEISGQIDYEAEIAVVIGKGGRGITRQRAMDHVFGYTIVNDVTARDVQMRHSQWDLGKSFDTFCPMGPWIATSDELDGQDTRVRCWVNGDLRQDALTRDLIFDIPSLVETCSRGITLYPGDIIATGTPAGVGLGQVPPRFLQAGDVVRIEVDGIGVIENTFR